MLSSRNYLGRLVLSVGFFALLFVSMFGIFHYSMAMSMDGTMSDCAGMPGMNVCPMTPFEHVSFMQNFFSNIPPQQDMTLALILAIGFVALTSFAWFRQSLIPSDSLRSIGYFYRNKQYSIVRLFQELFSLGILNPKPF